MARYRSLDDPQTLRKFVRNLREGIYITSPGGALLDANPAMLEIFGVDTVEELRGYSAPELFVDPGQREEEMRLLLRNGAVREFEFQVKRPDGGVRTVLDTCHVVEDEGDR